MTLYKWILEHDGHLFTAVRRTPWPVEVGAWTAKETPVLGESGWHGLAEKDVLGHLPREIGAQLWEVEVRGKRLNGQDNFVAPQMRLVRLVGVTTDENLRLFICDVAEDVLHFFEDANYDDQRPRQAIEVVRRFVRGEATRKELVDAAEGSRDAARDATGAARAAARAARAAWAVAWTAEAVAWVVAETAWAAVWAAKAASGARGARGAAEGVTAAWAAAVARYSNWLVVRLESGYWG